MATGGMSNLEVIRIGTLMGAQALGLDQDVGSLEAGKFADLIILDKNPLEDIHNSESIRSVMKNGRLYDGNTLDESWPRARTLGPQWWQGQEPGGKE
jgi:imidazolonepropionase-like amidohydrolase